MIPLPFPAPYLYLAVFVAGLAGGGYGVHTWYKAQRVEAIQDARVTERDGARLGNQADVRYLDRMLEQRAHAETNATAYERALNEANLELAYCRVDVRTLGVLNAAGAAEPAGAAGSAGPGAAPAEAARDSTAAAELDVCRANYAEVCVPNAEQLRRLQRWYLDLRERFNK